MPLLFASFCLVIAGCTGVRVDDAANDVGVDGIACAGHVGAPVEGLVESENPVLLSSARKPSGKGGVCAARVYAVTAPVVLFRVFDAGKPYTKQGGWWALQKPVGSREGYRAANAICPEWSALDRLVSCEVMPGTQVVLGTTQSAECADGSTYPRTGVIQVFVPNNGRAGVIHVGNCKEEGVWP